MSVRNSKVLPPTTERYKVIRWLKQNFFQNWFNGVITLLLSVGLFRLIFSISKWVLHTAQWSVISNNIVLFMIGQYPRNQISRVWICVGLMGFLIALTWGLYIKNRWTATILFLSLPLIFAIISADTVSRNYWLVILMICLTGYAISLLLHNISQKIMIIGWTLFVPIVIFLLRGSKYFGDLMPVVNTNFWGGLLLTTLIGGIGMVVSFPLGVLLAIGRVSRYPVMRGFCVAYIELIRAVPLITVLFMAQTMLPLFLPSNINIDRVLRAIVAFTLFSAAYMAENVRGGLQNIPKEQYEAASALGLRGSQTMRLIIMPQALRSIIPIITSSVIGGFRDTSLVLIIGLLDLLGIAKAALAQPDFLGRHIEVYVFLAAVYWAISFAFSYIGQIIEERKGLSFKNV